MPKAKLMFRFGELGEKSIDFRPILVGESDYDSEIPMYVDIFKKLA